MLNQINTLKWNFICLVKLLSVVTLFFISNHAFAWAAYDFEGSNSQDRGSQRRESESSSSDSRVFRRSEDELEACKLNFKKKLRVQYLRQMDQVCSDYTDENLECAAEVIQKYNISQYSPAITYCLLEYKTPNFQPCVNDKIDDSKSSKKKVDIEQALSECQKEDEESTYQREKAREKLREDESREANIDPDTGRHSSQSNLGPMRGSGFGNDSSGEESLLKSKLLTHEHFKNSVSKWLQVNSYDISSIAFKSFHNPIDSFLEGIAVKLLGREWVLYRVTFNVLDNQFECVGTEYLFSENTKDKNFGLHNCKVNGSAKNLKTTFAYLNYEFESKLSASFRQKMKDAKRLSKSIGTNRFTKSESEYLVLDLLREKDLKREDNLDNNVEDKEGSNSQKRDRQSPGDPRGWNGLL